LGGAATLKETKILTTLLYLFRGEAPRVVALATMLMCCAGCERPAPAWVQLACTYMVQHHQYTDQVSCLAAARRDGAYWL